ncbi:serine/threonine-protein kinase [Leptothoe sp. PORK10 BA2]|uniref:serine/threonine-protein kinase n=1 Tax=Leptothoe sp. PORK10 BA2 TaxID=3110254 RepID=UPI002B221943|nr:serine/threonine-protein kinase [Leptothoe sp. PORK10 BA2]MEA5466037.1 serine/threonine-protein kinase [Leptothoe sp. PORK10 BA2]
MPYCLNCDYAHNPDGDLYCHQCGALLALRGRFNISRQIGEGGFGKTYLAADLDNRHKSCVVKQLVHQGENPVAAQESRRLFEQEAERLDQLNHPQIPQLLAYFEHDQYLYLVQEFIDGHDLQAELRRQGAFTEAQIWEILRELLPILAFIHGHQVIHRDLKPENVMRRECDRKLFLIDFGVAKLLAETGNMGGTVVGTPGYAPPEQMQGRVSPASDLFSLGMICFHLLTQKSVYQLFQAHNYTWVDHWQRHLNAPISQRLEQVLAQLLKLDEKERYVTAEDVLQALNDQKPVVRDARKESSKIYPFVRTAKSAKTRLQQQTTLFARPVHKLLLVFGVAGVLGAGLWYLLRPQPDASSPKIALLQGWSESVLESSPPSTADDSSKPMAESFAQVTQVPTGIFNYGGSTTWAPIRGSVDVEIQTARPEFRLRYVPPEDVPPSSQAGLEMLVQGKVDFSLASRLPSNELLEELAAKGINIRLVPVAENFDVAAVNLDLAVDQLTIDQLNAILEGRVRNWREVGGPDLEITRFDRDVNENFMDTRPNLESDNMKLFTTPSEAVGTAPDFPGGIYVHTAAMLIPQCLMKTLTLVNGEGQKIIPYQEPLVPAEQCPIQKNQVNLAALGSGNYPRQLQDTLYVVINQNGGMEQQVGEAYANFLLSDEGQTLLEKAGYLKIRQ